MNNRLFACVILWLKTPFLTRSLEVLKSYHCPSNPETNLIVSPESLVSLSYSSKGQLCSLIRITNDQEVATVGRSYDGHPWESVAGIFSKLDYSCEASFCEVEIPITGPDQVYYLTSNVNNVTPKNEIARFLEQVTFGTTRNDLEIMRHITSNYTQNNNGILSWLQVQLSKSQTPPTSHRALWRKHTSPRASSPGKEGTTIHPCSSGSRWRRASFTTNDKYKYVEIQMFQNRYMLIVDKRVRTILDRIDFISGIPFHGNETASGYKICSINASMTYRKFGIEYNGNCELLLGGNPPVSIEGVDHFSLTILGLPQMEDLIQFERHGYLESVKLKLLHTVHGCHDIPKNYDDLVAGPIFGRLTNDQILIYDSTLALQSNTIVYPLGDGGGTVMNDTDSIVKCSNVPRTSLNEEYCKIGSDQNICSSTNQGSGKLVLNKKHIMMINSYDERKYRYIYAITGLRVHDDDDILPFCKPGTSSRWVKDYRLCQPENIRSRTRRRLLRALNISTDDNPIFKDLYLPLDENCHPNDTDKRQIYFQDNDGHCWMNIHPDTYNVYDFTEWVDTHPGNTPESNKISWFLENGHHYLKFPGPEEKHPMIRWSQVKHHFNYIGRLGDQIDFRDLPAYLKDSYLKLNDMLSGGPGSIVCGSVGEIANDAPDIRTFDIHHNKDDDGTKSSVLAQQRKSVWAMIAVTASDQLRQKVAWALSQILVISPETLTFQQTECFLSYYDIFVRNAFGNYRVVLREVAYSPLMAQMLTYYQSKSTDYVWDEERKIKYPDENFSRELMQLFSIGTVQLNIDGTPVIGLDGKTVPTYDNDVIMEYARAWTGFINQDYRGNIEQRDLEFSLYSNDLDPMRIETSWRDVFPKLGLDGKYVGDGYVLCLDLPEDTFLRKGAKYRLLGQSVFPELQAGGSIITLSQSSLLREKLCNSDGHECTYPGVVWLEENLDCTELECKMRNKDVHVVKVNKDLYYEYIRPPCVNFSFLISNDVVAIIVNEEGHVAMERIASTPQDSFYHTYFRVLWKGHTFPSVKENLCLDGACQIFGPRCICQVTVKESGIFSSCPSRSLILSDLFIGGIPAAYRNNYSSTYHENENVSVHIRANETMSDMSSIFEVTDDFGRRVYKKNMNSNVIIQGGNQTNPLFSFRNPPSFLIGGPEIRDAQYETEAVLDQVMYHNNTAPFLSIRLIQRLGISNPSPRYVQSVSSAFISGSYTTVGFNDSVSFGTGQYGDLSATIAAILLDRESRSAVLDADFSHGSIREPLVKVIATMRSLEYTHSDTSIEYLSLFELESKIGQMAHHSPSVFSFFLPEYAPGGVIEKAGLVSPESMLLHKSIGLSNGLTSLVNFGLSSCLNGFWDSKKKCRNPLEGKFKGSVGRLSYTPTNTSTIDAVIDELSTLLTSGRMSKENRAIIKKQVAKSRSRNSALRSAQRLLLLSPEFHALGISRKTLVEREVLSFAKKTKTPGDYKAVVHLMLKGGCDSYNMLIPHTCSDEKDLYTEYKNARGDIALAKEDLLTIDVNATSQQCSKFGIHPNLPILQDLFNTSEAIFLTNIGVLTEPVDRENYRRKSLTQLFAHNAMQAEILRQDPFVTSPGTGVLGRISDALTKKNLKVSSFSIDTSLVSLASNLTNYTKVGVNSKEGLTTLNVKSPSELETIIQLNGANELRSNAFAETWSSNIHRDIFVANDLFFAQENASLTVSFPDNNLGRKFKWISKMTSTNKARGSERDVFHLEFNGFDTHHRMEERLNNLFMELNDSLEQFSKELKSQNKWDKMVIIVTSDFGRTLSSNSGKGTDHGWGGNSFVLGGGLKGKQIFGQYPNDLSESSPLNTGRGRLIPTMPWELPFSVIAQWLGIKDDVDLSHIFPNLKSFPPETILQEYDFFQHDSKDNF